MISLWLLGCSQPFIELGDSAVDSDTPVDTDTGVDSDTDAPLDTSEDVPLELCINEFMPANVASAYDEGGDATDWIELHNPGDAAVDLQGWTISDDPDEPDKHSLDLLSIGREAYLLLWASGDISLGEDHVDFKLSEDGGDVLLYAPDGRGSVVSYGSVESDYAISRTTDCCVGDGCLDFSFRGTPGYSNEPVIYETIPLLAPASTWSYWTGATVDAGWTSPSYDDSLWPTGPAPLGYGDLQTTQIPYGDDATNKWPTAWFRTRFDATSVDGYATVSVGVMRDDGVAVYLNGVEVVRDGLPEGVLLPETLASAIAVSETSFYTFTIDPFALVEGENVVSAEVHQYTVDSSDLTFDLQLSASRIVSE